MADLVANTYSALHPEDVLVRAVQFFTNEKWRVQSQTNRIATFVGMNRVSWFQIMLAVMLTMFFIVPGVIYYLVVISKMRRLQNLVVTTTPRGLGCDVVVTYPSHVQGGVNAFFAAVSAPQDTLAMGEAS